MLIDADGFDHYGTGLSSAATAAMLALASYANVQNMQILATLNGVNPPSGLGFLACRSYQSGIARPVSSGAIRQSQQAKFNFTAGFLGTEGWGVSFHDAAHNDFLRFVFRSNGAIAITNSNTFNNGTILAQSAAATYRPGTWQNFEFVYVPNTGAGTGPSPYNGIAQVWLEGVLVAQAVGLSIGTACAFHFIGWQAIVGASPEVAIKDWISVDNSTAYVNNVPMGPRRCQTRIMTGDGATDNWVIGGAAATRWQAVAKNAPDLTTYVEGDNPGDVQEFTMSAPANAVAAVTGIIVKAYAQKTNSGAGTFKLSILSAGSVANSPEITPGVGGAYWGSGAFPFDPATGNPFSGAAYSAIGLRITRVQ